MEFLFGIFVRVFLFPHGDLVFWFWSCSKNKRLLYHVRKCLVVFKVYLAPLLASSANCTSSIILISFFLSAGTSKNSQISKLLHSLQHKHSSKKQDHNAHY